MNALIVGERGVGKSTLIRKVLQELNCPVSGFETRKETQLADKPGSPVYIYEVGQPCIRTRENLLGLCKNGHCEVNADVFDRYAEKISALASRGVILLDEIGFMESASEAYCQAVLKLLDGDTPVMAAVKNKSTPFLERVRSHPNCHCFFITEENRNTLFEPLSAFVSKNVFGNPL